MRDSSSAAIASIKGRDATEISNGVGPRDREWKDPRGWDVCERKTQKRESWKLGNSGKL